MRTFTGKVISTKMQNTIVVAVDTFRTHPKYKKIIKRTTKLLAHNEIGDIKENDQVKIGETRPYSKKKHFKVIEKIK